VEAILNDQPLEMERTDAEINKELTKKLQRTEAERKRVEAGLRDLLTDKEKSIANLHEYIRELEKQLQKSDQLETALQGQIQELTYTVMEKKQA
jgi:seryl-tRNA synthetase